MTETAWVIVGGFVLLAAVFGAGWLVGWSAQTSTNVDECGQFGTAGSFVDDFGDEIDITTGLAIIRDGPQRPTLKGPPPGFYERRRPVRPLGAPPSVAEENEREAKASGACTEDCRPAEGLHVGAAGYRFWITDGTTEVYRFHLVASLHREIDHLPRSSAFKENVAKKASEATQGLKSSPC